MNARKAVADMRRRVLKVANEDPFSFLACIERQKNRRMQVGGKTCVFVRDFLNGGVKVSFNSITLNLAFEDGLWTCR